MSTLYDSDFLRWTEQQTELLRRRAAGEPANDEGLGWLNLAEEIDSVGASEKREVRPRLMRICQHLLKWKYQPEQAAEREAGLLHLPDDVCPWSLDQVLAADFLPD